MSSTESSGAPAEATATPPAPAAAFPTFGSTRGSGLARGKRPAAGPAASTAASTEYTPTAIEVVNAPREYQNPFAPAEEPAAASTAPSAVGLAKADAPAIEKPAPVAAVAAAPVQNDDPAELNILEPAQQKIAPAQTWESEGFEPVRESRNERPRRDEQSERPRREEQSERPAREERTALTEIPEKFLYVRPGHTYVPTPSNFGGAPRERNHGDGAAPARSFDAAPAAEAPAKSGGFFGWLKSLFGGSSAGPVTAASSHGEHRHEGSQRRHRGGRNRGGQGGGGYSGGGEGGQRRDRGGRGRSGGGYRGERSEGSRQGGV